MIQMYNKNHARTLYLKVNDNQTAAISVELNLFDNA